MQRIRPFAQLMRLHKPIGIWLLAFPALWAVLMAPGEPRWSLLPIMLLGAVLIRSAGCILNDLVDQQLDAQVARTRQRPLASGSVSRRDAWVLLAVLLFDGLLLCAALPLQTVFWAALALPLIAAYPWMKRLTFWPQAFLGLTFNFGALIGWAATGQLIAPVPILLYGACFFWTLGYDTLYAVEDMDDDRKAGIKSTARRIGLKRDLQLFVGSCYALMLVFFYSAALAAGQLSMLVIAAIVLAAFHAAGQVADAGTLRAGSPQAGRLFRSNQWLGLILLLGLILSRAFPYLS